MRPVALVAVALTLAAGCADRQQVRVLPPPTLAEQAAENARREGAEDLARRRAAVFGMEWAVARTAMRCNDTETRLQAYALAQEQERHLAWMWRYRRALADISAAEDARMAARLRGQPTAQNCARMRDDMAVASEALQRGER